MHRTRTARITIFKDFRHTPNTNKVDDSVWVVHIPRTLLMLLLPWIEIQYATYTTNYYFSCGNEALEFAHTIVTKLEVAGDQTETH